jgi:signal transduction histidine kinase
MSTVAATARPRWFGLPRRVAAGFLLAVASLAAAGLCSMIAMRTRTQASRAVAHATENQLVLEEVESALLVSDVALDAYIASGDRRHRARHLRARGKLAPAMDRLAQLVVAEAPERAIGDRLLPVVREIRDEQDRALGMADAGYLRNAAALRSRPDAPSVESAHQLLESLEQHEEQELARRRYAWERTQLLSNIIFHGAQVVLLVLVVVAARLVRDEIRAREAREAERAHALEVQQRLIAVVSHDLRNPLSGILTAAWALTRSDLPEDARRVSRRIAAAGRRMERLIRDLLDWSRAKAGAEIPVEVQRADLFDVCVRVAEDLGDSRASRIQLVRDGDTYASFDPDRMEQVIANLLTNALKYGAPDRPVRLGAVGENDAVRLEVCDEGPGIDPAIRREIFEPFRHAPPGAQGAKGSVGLGLFVVQTLARAQGAAVEVQSAPGSGTTFVVRIPREPGARSTKPRATA